MAGPRLRRLAAGLVLLLLASSLGVLSAPQARAEKGAPDAYGYVWVDNQAPSPVIQYNWIDISTTGTALSLTDDACTFEVPIGFQFRFYGTLQNDIFVCSNGWISFNVPSTFDGNPPIPSPADPNNRIVGMGIDLNPQAGGTVYVRSFPAASPRQFVVQWERVIRTGTTQRQTFEIVLEQGDLSRDGRILLQYASITLSSAPNGIENRTGSSGLVYPKPLGNGRAVAFLPPSDQGLPPDTLLVTGTDIAPRTVVQGDQDVPMLDIRFSTATNDVQVAAVTVVLSGLRADPGDVPLAELWVDNGDGVFQAGVDIRVSGSAFAATPPRAVLQIFPALPVTMSSPRRVFVTYDIAPDAGVGDWIGARLTNQTSVSVAFPDLVSSSGFPVDTYRANVQTEILASVDSVLLLGNVSHVPGNVTQWQTDVPLITLVLDADRNVIPLSGIRATFQGNVTAGDLWAAKLAVDNDANGVYTRGVDDLLSVVRPQASPPRAMFYFSRTLVAGTPLRFLVLLDVAPDGVVGRTFNVTVGASDVFFPPASADVVSATRFPATSANATIQAGARPVLESPWSDPAPIADGTWSMGEYLLGPAHSVPFDRPAGNAVIGLLTVENNGTRLYVAVDATSDFFNGTTDGVSIGFDTDGNGAPTNGADDVFAINKTSGRHYRYNASASDWTVVGPCAREPVNASEPACAAGFGPTESGASNHVFWEFSIPFALLGFPTPIPPNTTVRMALGVPPYFGVRDDTNTSSWPLLFPPLPLTHFGQVNFTAGPQPNVAPELNWTGEAGYVSDGLEPEAANAGTPFRWRISYLDRDGDLPALTHPRLIVLRGGVPMTPFALTEDDPSDRDVTDGKVYATTLTLTDCTVNYTYYFTARDGRGAFANATVAKVGPVVGCVNEPPILTGADVIPNSGVTGSSFRYRVAYLDPEGAPPSFVTMEAKRGGASLGTWPTSFSGWVSVPGDFSQGAWYEVSLVLSVIASDYTFQFNASDGTTVVQTGFLLGPQVVPVPPDLLSVTGFDPPAPLLVDAGARMVPFYRLVLFAGGQGVNLTSLRADRVGFSVDADVQRVLLYHDRDNSATITPGDVELGSRAPVLASVTFPVFVPIAPGTSISLLLLVNVSASATANATIGLEITDRTYLSVDAGDDVVPFAPLRSTRAIVNRGPDALNLRVDGYAAGSMGIDRIVPELPTVSWDFVDPNLDPPGGHNVSIWSSSPLALLWWVNRTGPDRAAQYAGAPFQDGTPYLLRVRVTDGRLWSPRAEIPFRTNTPPPTPLLRSPQDLAVNAPIPATIAWDAVSDPDGDSVTYEWWVSDNPGFTPTLSGTTTASNVTLNLLLGTQYYWKVRASDGYELSGPSTVWRFATTTQPGAVRGSVSGRVLDGPNPIPGAVVILWRGPTPLKVVMTTANGTFSFGDLDLGTYLVNASAVGFVPGQVSVEVNATSPNATVDLVLRAQTGPGDGGRPGGLGPDANLWSFALLAILPFLLYFLATRLRRRKRGPEERARDDPPPDSGDESPPVGPVAVDEGGSFERMDET